MKAHHAAGGDRDLDAAQAWLDGLPVESAGKLVDDATDALERRVFFDQLSSGYETLRADSDAWRQVEDERAVEGG